MSRQLTAMVGKRRAGSRGNETRYAGRATGDRGRTGLGAIIALATISAWGSCECRLGYPSESLFAGWGGAAKGNDHADRRGEHDRQAKFGICLTCRHERLPFGHSWDGFDPWHRESGYFTA